MHFHLNFNLECITSHHITSLHVMMWIYFLFYHIYKLFYVHIYLLFFATSLIIHCMGDERWEMGYGIEWRSWLMIAFLPVLSVCWSWSKSLHAVQCSAVQCSGWKERVSTPSMYSRGYIDWPCDALQNFSYSTFAEQFAHVIRTCWLTTMKIR